VRAKRESGVALITALLVLFLVSALVVGMSWMVMSDSRLGGNNEKREVAFYGAEAGMEKMTADLGNIFAVQGAVTPANITTVEGEPPANIPGITFVNALGQSTYQITAGTEQFATILPPSPYAGMNGQITPYTLTVAAQADSSSEVKLQRTVQLVAIPVFQFGIFSQTDLAFFAGPQFDFGGRVHTNGNLWLAANPGPLYMRDKVTASGQIIRTNLENGTAVNSGSYGGAVVIADPAELPTTTAYPPSPSYTNSQWQALALNAGSVSGTSIYGNVSTTVNTSPSWPKATEPSYQGMLTNGVQPLNLQSTALGGLQSPVNLIRRPLVNEINTNPAQFAQRQFTQASLRIMLDDHGPSGTCHDSPMMGLDTVSNGTDPIDLASLTSKPTTWSPAWPASTTFYPIAASNSASLTTYTTYTKAGAKDGYWQKRGNPIITGCIKIEYQPTGGPPFVDVTEEVLGLGYLAKNINPTPSTSAAQNTVPFLSATGTVVAPETSLCGGATDASEPNPDAIIRIERVRDNPSTAYSGTKLPCTFVGTTAVDYWPLVLYDTREAISRDVALGNNANDSASNHPLITAQGVIDYIELDVNNLDRWFTGAIGSSGTKASNLGGFSVYFSDRRGNQVDPAPTVGVPVGAFGFNDIVNLTDPTNGCPNSPTMDAGEDLEGDGTLRVYGGVPLWNGATNGTTTTPLNIAIPNLLTGVPSNVFAKNPTCPVGVPVSAAPAPDYVYTHNDEARENPPMFFRRALKLEYGSTLNLGTSCYGAPPNPPCGLTIVAENPVYIQGEYNDGGVNTGTWTGTNVAASVMADAVTFLSDQWNDVNSFISPYDPGSRPGSTTSYRLGIIAGKGIPFPVAGISNSGADYGTDGGVHNFLRYLESWSGYLYYKGSIVSFYFNRQDVGLYKCCTTVYGPPNRGYNFDGEFAQGPQWLPPRTPKLTSINTIGFTQEILPTQ